ncbi:MAG: hypothetical protein KVP17_002020 [Porospora cf. gigantea B]|uniref:uncharacterized protein n=1 Tax=Porospora cf. gigantea B TaxID=2853592 RepID=UPI0035718554|nr:MAG: hypothetical protein KVP17_002020 [Porospora cf. gigantea B]
MVKMVWWCLFVSTLAAIESLVKLDAVVKSKYGLHARLPYELLEASQNVGILCLKDLPKSSGVLCLAKVFQHCSEAISRMQREASFHTQKKTPADLVTSADKYCHSYISQYLLNAYSREIESRTMLLISEEGKVDHETAESFSERQALGRSGLVWLLDPIDSTEGFVRRAGGYYTVNLGLVKDTQPIFGMVSLPKRWTAEGEFIKDELTDYYVGVVGAGAYKLDISSNRLGPLAPSPRLKFANGKRGPVRVMASMYNSNQSTQAFVESVPDRRFDDAGSSVKILRIAEGKADIYPRYVGTMEWDTAAAHAILKAVGGDCFNVGTEEAVLVKSFPEFKTQIRSFKWPPVPPGHRSPIYAHEACTCTSEAEASATRPIRATHLQ